MKLHELYNTVPPGAQACGRGDGSGHGRTAGRGDKGAGACMATRGARILRVVRFLDPPLPKRGFKNPNHLEYNVVNLAILEVIISMPSRL